MGQDSHYTNKIWALIARNTHGIAVIQDLRNLMEQANYKLD